MFPSLAKVIDLKIIYMIYVPGYVYSLHSMIDLWI